MSNIVTINGEWIDLIYFLPVIFTFILQSDLDLLKGIDDEDEEELDDFEEDMDADPVKRDDVIIRRNQFIYISLINKLSKEYLRLNSKRFLWILMCILCYFLFRNDSYD